MLRRISILSIIAMLSFLMFGESRADNGNNSFSSKMQTEISIVDADIPNSTSLLSGRSSYRVVNGGNRLLQRTISKHRVCSFSAVAKLESEISLVEHSQNKIQSNVLGVVVGDKAFYSLCCLRI